MAREAVQEATQNLVPAGATQRARALAVDHGVGGIMLGRFREYEGGFAVPPDFSFPSPNLRSAWEFFLRGFPSNMSKDESGAVIRTPVRPLRYIKDATDKHLPRGRVRKKFVDDWKPVLSFMYNKTKQHIINVPEESMDADFLDATYVAAREQLEEKYPSLFEGINADRNRTWKVSNWSKKIKTLNRQYRLEAI